MVDGTVGLTGGGGNPPSIAIIGAGVTGLTIAHGLVQRGIPGGEIAVYEAQQTPGGMAGTFSMNGVRLDRFYHFLCAPDREYVAFLSDLNLSDRLRWRRSDMAFFDRGRLIRFSGGVDLLRYPGVDLLSKVRYAALVAAVRAMRDWRHLEHITARQWLHGWLGRRGYEAFWAELIRRKFGPHSDRVCAAWIWARIRRNAQSRRFLLYDWLGYVRGGTGVFLDELVRRLSSSGVTIRCGLGVERVDVDPEGAVEGIVAGGEKIPASRVIYAGTLIRLPSLLHGPVPRDYVSRLQRLESIGLVCVVLELLHPLTGRFWTNIVDPDTPQTGLVEFTALAPDYHPMGRSVVYLPHYRVLDDAELATLDLDGIVRAALPHFARLNSRFRPEWITGKALFAEQYAQPVCPVGFTSSTPGFDTGVKGLWALDHTMLLPDDRTIAGCIGLARSLLTRLETTEFFGGQGCRGPR
ncbi:MAG: FAD-dependent oxidoreductase [Candidatus Eisenbacteria bacterium]|nr:FAD-dependent oxidoreductase [Candidatus Eisenbacteria bacterium]